MMCYYLNVHFQGQRVKIAPTCFGAVTPSSGSALFVLAKVTLVKIVNCGISVCGDVAAYINRSLLV